MTQLVTLAEPVSLFGTGSSSLIQTKLYKALDHYVYVIAIALPFAFMNFLYNKDKVTEFTSISSNK